MPRESTFQRVRRWIGRQKHARLLEFALFGVPGIALFAVAWWGGTAGWLAVPIAWMIGIAGVCLLGFGLLPPLKEKVPPPANPKSRRR